MTELHPAPKALLVFAGVSIVLWSVAAVVLSMQAEMLFADYDKPVRLSAILLLLSAVAAPLLMVAFQRWRLVVWLGAMAACLVMANVPWCGEKAFYLRAEEVPRGATVDEVKAHMKGYSIWPLTTSPSDIEFNWDGNFATFKFEDGKLAKVHLIPD